MKFTSDLGLGQWHERLQYFLTTEYNSLHVPTLPRIYVLAIIAKGNEDFIPLYQSPRT
jgi:hypothetical protein